MTDIDIILVANSPGELSALVRPIAQKFKEKAHNARIIVFLTPCQYSSGNEIEYVKNYVLADAIVTADQYKKWLIGGQLPNNLSLKYKGIVLFLGGDLLHATLISKKLGYKAYAYLANKTVSWTMAFEKFFVPYRKLFKNKIPEQKLIEVSDLMAEPMPTLSKEASKEKWKIESSRKVIAMMPGSRLWEIKHLLPLYAKIGQILKKTDPDILLMLIVSPFTSMKDIESFKEHAIFDVFTPFDSITAAELVVTIPGTNTAQIAALGLPMLVIFPLDKPEDIPLEGLAHYITSIPILGYAIKKILVKIANSRTKYFALPNILADDELVPEIRGKIDPENTADKILEMLNDKDCLDTTSRNLKDLLKPSNSSEKIVQTILNENL
ncbi:hypothetical protein HZC34_03570 [Candidatus Saganbacteria bacterium]|nr:hypothetical protein [Candidatus Saganbacteria bacterium]